MFNVKRITYNVLETIAESPDKTQHEMADCLDICRTTFYYHLKALVATEHVIVKRGGRNHPNRYYITEIGIEALKNGKRRRA